jgi:beta-lactam-binding protein with PASTA domain
VRGTAVGAPPVAGAPAAAAAGGAAATAVMRPVPGGTQVLPPTRPTSAAAAPPAEVEPHRSRKGLVWFLVILGLAAIGGIVAIAMQSGTPILPNTVNVPNLDGLDEAEARQTLTDAELEMSAQSEPSDTVDDGLAIRWEPTDEAEKGAVVTVWFSSGPEQVVIPDVTGLTQERARQVLATEGLTGEILTTTRDAAGQAADIALGTEPGVGQSVAPDAQITLVLATGLVDVPSMVGSTEADASAKLDELQVRPRIIYQTDAGEPGIVLEQDRSGKIPVDATVTLTISEAAAAPTPSPTATAPAVPVP